MLPAAVCAVQPPRATRRRPRENVALLLPRSCSDVRIQRFDVAEFGVREPGPTAGRTPTGTCCWDDAARASTRERLAIRCGERAEREPATDRQSADRMSARMAGGMRGGRWLPPRRDEQRAIRAADPGRFAKPLLQHEAWRCGGSSPDCAGGSTANRRKPPLLPSFDDWRALRSHAGRFGAGEPQAHAADGADGSPPTRQSRQSRTAVYRHRCTLMPPPARRRARGSKRAWQFA